MKFLLEGFCSRSVHTFLVGLFEFLDLIVGFGTEYFN